MNFISNVLDSIPVVGHVKGVVHYAVGDKDGGHKAIYQSTRTTAVLAGGAAGCLAGGPAGAVAGGVYAGMAADGLASVAMDKPQGILKSCEDVAKDLKTGKSATGSVLSIGFQVGLDAVGGFGMGGVSSAASQISEKAVAKTIENVGKKVVSTVGEEIIEKSAKITAEEMAKMVTKKGAEEMAKRVTKKVTEKTVEQVIKQVAIGAEVVLVTSHVAVGASERTENENRAERDRRAREERERIERENRAREERERRERENRAREERERIERENRAREERERIERENRAREERERREMENRAREERERIEREKRASEERERREMENRAREENQPRQSQNRGHKEEQSRGRSGTNPSSSQPPQENRNNHNKSDEEIEAEFEKFMEFLEKILKVIYGNGTEPISRIFRGLSINQKRYLVKIITELKNNGMLDAVVELVIKMFKQHFHKDISFTNFLSLSEFLAAYIADELNERMISRGTSTSQPRMTYKERRRRTLTDIINQEDLVTQLVNKFNELRAAIEAETSGPNNIFPNFRDIFSAVYHYWKHRRVPGDGTLSVREYYDWIRKLLEKLKKTPEYNQLRNSRKPGTCRYEMYVVLFGRRFRIVVKVYGDQLVLSSAFVVTIMYQDDKDGDVFILLTFP